LFDRIIRQCGSGSEQQRAEGNVQREHRRAARSRYCHRLFSLGQAISRSAAINHLKTLDEYRPQRVTNVAFCGVADIFMSQNGGKK